jgi:hypothetical protein
MLKIGFLFIIASFNFYVEYDSQFLGVRFVAVLSIDGWMTEYNLAIRETTDFQSLDSVSLVLNGSVWFAYPSYLS